MQYGYQAFNTQSMARAASTAMPISSKHAREIAAFLRNRKLQKAKQLLAGVVAMRQAVPFTRFNKGMGHKAGMAAGSYPVNASKVFLALLESVEANAQSKGLNTNALVIVHCTADRGGKRFHGGRHGGRLMKRTHLQVVVAEPGAAKTAEEEKPAVPA